MADGYDGFDKSLEYRDGGSGGSFIMGLLTGTVLGAGLGMLFAPKAGSQLRSQLSEQAGNVANQASEGYRRASETASQWAEKGRDVYNKASDAVVKGTQEAQKYVRDTASSAQSGSERIRGSANE
jgi:gas vesicle protein